MSGSITSAFIAKLLAPLPAEEEQADTRAFRKAIERDMLQIWLEGMEQVKLAEAAHTIAAIERRNSGEPIGYGPKEAANIEAYQARVRAEAKQCLIPAPTLKELRWKKRRGLTSKLLAEVAPAIAADEAWLGVAQMGGC